MQPQPSTRKACWAKLGAFCAVFSGPEGCLARALEIRTRIWRLCKRLQRCDATAGCADLNSWHLLRGFGTVDGAIETLAGARRPTSSSGSGLSAASRQEWLAAEQPGHFLSRWILALYAGKANWGGIHNLRVACELRPLFCAMTSPPCAFPFA